MIFLHGVPFDERLLVRKALTSLYGISQTSTTWLQHRAPASLPLLSTKLSSSSQTSSPSSQSPSSKPTKSSKASEDAATAPPSAFPKSASSQNLLAQLLATHHIHPTARLRDLPEQKVVALTASLAELTIEMDLRRRVQQNIARMRDMGSYKGRRHAMNLPVRGQRTRTQIGTARRLNRVDRRG